MAHHEKKRRRWRVSTGDDHKDLIDWLTMKRYGRSGDRSDYPQWFTPPVGRPEPTAAAPRRNGGATGDLIDWFTMKRNGGAADAADFPGWFNAPTGPNLLRNGGSGDDTKDLVDWMTMKRNGGAEDFKDLIDWFTMKKK